jgi:hypothetical protein
MVNRLLKHVAPAGEIERMVQLINKPFRFAVLAQPRWLAGQFVEPYLVRLPMYGSGIILPGLAMDLRAAKRLAKGMGDQALSDEIEGEMGSGLLIGNRGASNYRTAEDLPGLLRHGKVFAQLPVVKQMAWFVKHGVTMIGRGFFAANRLIEHQVQMAGRGHLIRHEVQEFTGSWTQALRMSDKAVQQMAKGLRNTETQQRFAAQMDEMLGKYSRWSPTTRRLIQTIFPFIPWSMAAARFVFWTMPAHHSVKTALLLKASMVNSQAWKDEHAGTPPGSLRIAARRNDGGFVDLARYTPYGFSAPLAEGDRSIVSQSLLPQISGFVHALNKQDPFGRTFPKGTNETVATLNTLAEAFVPLLAQARRLREHGETGLPDSTLLSPKTKPGTSHGMSALERTFSPVRPTYVKASGSGGSSGANLDPIDREALRRAVHSQTGPKLDPIDQAALERALKGR